MLSNDRQIAHMLNIDKNNYPGVVLFHFILVTTPRFFILRTSIHHAIWGGMQRVDEKSMKDESQLDEIGA